MSDTYPTRHELARTINLNAPQAFTQYKVTVARLREMLADQPDDAIVVLSSDAEGNSYSPLTDEFGWSWFSTDGDIYDVEPEEGEEPFEPATGDLIAVVLYPA